MTALVSKIYDNRTGKTNDFSDGGSVANYINNLDPVAADTLYYVFCRSDIVLPTTNVGPKTSSDTQRVIIMPDIGYGTNELSTATFNYDASQGVKLYAANAYGSFIITSGLDVTGFSIPQSSAQGPFTTVGNHSGSTYDNIISRNRFYITSSGLSLGSSTNTTLLSNNLILTESTAVALNDKWNTKSQSNTYVARGAALNVTSAIGRDYGMPNTSENDVFIGFGSTIVNNMPVVNGYSNTAPTGGTTSGFTVNTASGGLVVNVTNDFRPAAGGGLIGKGNANAQQTLDILKNNRGTTADAGAWQLTPAVALPTATITNITVSGSSVTISGTTTGNPTSGSASYKATNDKYNDGIGHDQSPLALTLGTNTFTITFNNAHVGKYISTVTVTNGGGTSSATGTSSFEVVGATGTVTSQTLDGQTLTIVFTTNGNPTSASYTVPAAATNPNNAVTAGPSAVTLGSPNSTIQVDLQPGNYDSTLITLTTANGTSFPLTGTRPVSIIGISGNPTAPTPDASVVPGAPTNVVATAGDGTVSVAFTAPTSTGGSAITGYTVTSSNGVSKATTGSPISIAIANGTSVSFTVHATNANGNGPESASSNTVTPVAAAIVPGTPTGVAATAGDGFALVSFVIPSVNPGTSYEVTASTGQTASGLNSPIKITVMNNVPVTFTVKSVLNGIKSTASAISNSVTPQVSAVVTGVTLTPSSVVMQGNTSQKFLAFVQGSGSISPLANYSCDIGTIDANGNYTSPKGLDSQIQTATITAKSVTDPTQFATATVVISANFPFLLRSYNAYVRTSSGTAVGGAQVTILDQSTGTKVKIYADPQKSVEKYNPILTDADGYFEFFVESRQCAYTVQGFGIKTYTRNNIFDVSTVIDPQSLQTTLANLQQQKANNADLLSLTATVQQLQLQLKQFTGG